MPHLLRCARLSRSNSCSWFVLVFVRICRSRFTDTITINARLGLTRDLELETRNSPSHLTHESAARYVERFTRRVGGVAGGEKQSSLGDFVVLGVFAQRRKLQDLLF